MAFTIFDCLFVEQMKTKFLLTSIKLFTNSDNPSSNPLQELSPTFGYASLTVSLFRMLSGGLS
jgi:hypothetical protein